MLWGKFSEIEQHYRNHIYTYTLIEYNTVVKYNEYYDRLLINSLEFEIDSLEWNILKLANNEVVSAEHLLEKCNKDGNLKIHDVIECINNLTEERLLFHSVDYSEVIAVIDIETTK